MRIASPHLAKTARVRAWRRILAQDDK